MINNTVMSIKENECTGCGACFNKCPVGAIHMELNQEGFLFPRIDSSKCIKCGLCLKTCPVREPDYKNSSNPECYAAFAQDAVRENSSSGGAFVLAANYILDRGGYVCGAAYSDDYKKVEHILISDHGQISKLQSSKYVQSDMGSCYKEV